MVLRSEFCPVPIDQQPLQEYKSLLSSRFFSLPSKHFKNYLVDLFSVSVLISFLIIVLVLSSDDFTLNNNMWKIILNSFVFNDIVVLLLILRLYLSWSYVVKRLLSATVFYEESGWYDGQIWVKTSDMLIQDRLIAINQGIPLIKQVKLSFLIFCLKIIVESVISTNIL